MDCQKMDSIESLSRSFFKVQRSDKGQIWVFLLLFVNFLKSGLITFLYFLYTASLG